MSRQLTNEVEERRVVRLLAGAAEAVAPLADSEVELLIRRAQARSDRLRSPSGSGVRAFSVAAVAAGIALAVSLPTRGQPSGEPAGGVSPAAGLAAFPEGSALQLLLSRPGADHA